MAMDDVADTMHLENLWQARKSTQIFECESAVVELIIDGRQIMGDATVALQCTYTTPVMQARLPKNNKWDPVFFNIIDWESFGVIFRGMST